jgi:ABC-type multidrug transport system fused ATPase/permease subunit
MIAAFSKYIQVVTNLVMAATLIIVALLTEWTYSLLGFGLGACAIYGMKFVAEKTRVFSQKTTAENTYYQSILIQSIQAFKYISATARHSKFTERITSSIVKLGGYTKMIGILSAFVQSTTEPFAITLLCSLMYYQAVILEQSIAPIMVLLVLFYRVISSMFAFQHTWQNFVAYASGVDAIMQAERELLLHQEKRMDGEKILFKDSISLENVAFSYGKEKIFTNLNLQIRKNTTVAFVGESGAGKSTLVDLLTGILTPDVGTILVDNVKLSETDIQEWRKTIGYVTQENMLFDDSVLNNVSLWDTNSDSQNKTVNALEQSSALSFVDRMPNGYNSFVGDRGVKLSGGQRQRLAIARELYKQPSLLILDEATSALDSESELNIQRSIDLLRGKTTIIIIAHRLATVKNADHIYVLSNGQVVEEGSFEELVNKKTIFSSMVANQAL